ncbi:MAG: T9SS type A sorting domain-containing protein [Bacteroidia bacterium]|nr:T9SS type A sorting domain-containing protein [Bacteroidia bacterium]
MNGWSKISGIFIAQGGEKYITIGNFNPDTINADTIFVGGGHPTWMCAYYYIDEVLVMLDTTTHVNLSESKLSQIKIYPNPTKEFIYIETKGYYEEVGFELYDIYNTLVLKQNLQNKKIQRISLQSIRAGVYFYRITSETNIIENGKLVKISE